MTELIPGFRIIQPAVATDGTGAEFNLLIDSMRNTGVLQVDIIGTIAVQVQGRLSPDMGWVDLLDAPVTESTITGIILPKYVRVVRSGASGSPSAVVGLRF